MKRLLKELTKLSQKIIYIDSKIDLIRAKELQGIRLSEEDIKNLESFHKEKNSLKKRWDKIEQKNKKSKKDLH